jgi:hypothetical protein
LLKRKGVALATSRHPKALEVKEAATMMKYF